MSKGKQSKINTQQVHNSQAFVPVTFGSVRENDHRTPIPVLPPNVSPSFRTWKNGLGTFSSVLRSTGAYQTIFTSFKRAEKGGHQSLH